MGLEYFCLLKVQLLFANMLLKTILKGNVTSGQRFSMRRFYLLHIYNRMCKKTVLRCSIQTWNI